MVERVSPTRGDGYVITAQVEDASGGEMMLAVNGPAVSGMVETPQGSYTIRSDGAGGLVIREVDPSSITLCGTAPALATPIRQDASSSASASQADELPSSSVDGPRQPSAPVSDQLCAY